MVLLINLLRVELRFWYSVAIVGGSAGGYAAINLLCVELHFPFAVAISTKGDVAINHFCVGSAAINNLRGCISSIRLLQLVVPPICLLR